MDATSWRYIPGKNQIEYIGKIQNYRNYNSNNWILNGNGSPILNEKVINNSGVEIDVKVIRLKK